MSTSAECIGSNDSCSLINVKPTDSQTDSLDRIIFSSATEASTFTAASAFLFRLNHDRSSAESEVRLKTGLLLVFVTPVKTKDKVFVKSS